ncbi:hypothetical protein ACO0RG_000765 [Hanseniaspora osmophila]
MAIQSTQEKELKRARGAFKRTTTCQAFYCKDSSQKEYFSLLKLKSYQKHEISDFVKRKRARILLTVFMIPILFFFKQYQKVGSNPINSDTEQIFLDNLQNLKTGKLFLSESYTPLPLYLYSMFNSKDTNFLRTVNLLISCGILANVGVITAVLHRMPSLLTFLIQYILAKSDFFDQESLTISMDILVAYAITLTTLAFMAYKKMGGFLTWGLTCLSLGITISIKKIGFVTWIWVLLCYLYEFLVQINGDLGISTKKIWGYHFFVKIATLLLIPSTIFVIPYYNLVQNFDGSVQSLDYSSMSPTFKSSVLKNIQVEVPRLINANDTVLIRHVGSLGGYLHSHDAKYKTGSQEQQVTLFDYPDLNNEWIILPASEQSRTKIDTNQTDKFLMKKMQHIMLQHKVTGKFLYVSPTEKPPVNEKENASEVSCIDWDDELKQGFKFKLDFPSNAYTGDPNTDNSLEYQLALLPLDSVFELTSAGNNRGCHILAHDDRLPGWGFFQQEVRCVSSANKHRGKFFVEKSLPNLNHNLGTKVVPKMPAWKMVFEYIHRSWQKDYYNRSIEVEIKPWTVLTSLTKWLTPNAEQGTYMTTALLSSLLLLLGVSPMVLVVKMLAWNPIFESFENANMPLHTQNFLESTIMYSGAWFLHFYVFNFSKHPILFAQQYLPSFLFQLLQNVIVLQYVIDCIKNKFSSSR